ncbi:MAG: hypothetical protein QNJ97_09165 [Myxococcota bacterium]|nr:hypothetical protein [Myxococcota bacterium]
MGVSLNKAALLGCLVLGACLSHRAVASDKHVSGIGFSVLPGDARVISHALSASRDTGLLAYQVLPRVVLSTGGDVAFFGIRGPSYEVRAGMFGLIEVQTRDPDPLNFMTVPRGPYLWRGLLGYSVALSLDALAEQMLGHQGAFEVALSFRHESEHYTGSAVDIGEAFEGVPNIGDFVMPDVALRKVLGCVDVEMRVQGKLFLPHQAYLFGPGVDLIFRWHALPWVHPIWSVFGEYLFVRDDVQISNSIEIPDNYIVRSIAGLLFPGRAGDLQLVMTASVGNDKGLLAFEEEIRIGWAIRIGLFKSSPGLE